MALDLSPRYAQTIFEGDGGSYLSWTDVEFPILGEFAIGAGKLVLRPRGFGLPHYADSSKIGYVIQGDGGVAGMVFPHSKREEVVRLRKGDIISVPIGAASWWYNEGDTDLIIVFLGKASMAYNAGEFTYFLLSGPQGILSGFSPDFTGRILKLDQEETESMLASQKGVLIIKLDEGKTMPQPHKFFSHHKLITFNSSDHSHDVSVKNGGHISTFLGAKIPSLGQVGISVRLVRMEPNALSAPIYTADGTIQVTYILKGSGKVQIVGMNGKRVLDTNVKEGQLIVVPKFFAVAKLAYDEGMELITIFTSSQPVLEELGSKDSVWEALSSEAVEAALHVTPKMAKELKAKIRTEILIPSST